MSSSYVTASGPVVCDDVPSQLVSWLTTNGLQSPLSIASVGGGLISVSTLSFRASQSFRVLQHTKQCVYDVDSDDETIHNLQTDGRVTLQFEVLPTTFPFAPSASSPSPPPTPQLVTIQGTGRVCERGSNAYNALIPPTLSTQWYPRAIVAVGVQRVSISNGGPLMTSTGPLLNTPPSVPAFRRETTSGMRPSSNRSTPRPQPDFAATTTSNAGWGGWPVGGDACCAT